MKRLEHRSVALVCLLLLLPWTFLACGSTDPGERPLTPQEQDEAERLRVLLNAFLTNDESWPEERDRVLEQDPHMTELLVGNLVNWMIKTSRNAHQKQVPLGSWSPFRRCQDELVTLADHSASVLMALHTVVFSKERVDHVVLVPLQETLAQIGDPALPSLIARYDDADSRQERDSLLRVVARMGTSDALTFLERLRGSGDWQLRSRALEGIAEVAARKETIAAVRDRCHAALVQTLEGDADTFVRMRAARGLGVVGGTRSVRVLLKHYRDFSLQSTLARGRRRAEERGELLSALRKATGLHAAHQVQEFEAWLQKMETENGS